MSTYRTKIRERLKQKKQEKEMMARKTIELAFAFCDILADELKDRCPVSVENYKQMRDEYKKINF